MKSPALSPDDPRLEYLFTRLEGLAHVLTYWLDRETCYSALSIYLLSGVVTGLIQEGWPDEHTRPAIYTDVLAAIDRMGAELGPVIAQIEIDGRATTVRKQRQQVQKKSKTKMTVN